jgi:hypothetical protein
MSSKELGEKYTMLMKFLGVDFSWLMCKSRIRITVYCKVCGH